MDLRPLLEICSTTRHWPWRLDLTFRGQFFFPFFPFLLCSQWSEFSLIHFSDTFLSLLIWRRWRTSGVKVNVAAFCQDSMELLFQSWCTRVKYALTRTHCLFFHASPSHSETVLILSLKKLSFLIPHYSLDPPMGMCHSLIWALLFETCFLSVKVQVYLLSSFSYMSSSTKSSTKYLLQHSKSQIQSFKLLKNRSKIIVALICFLCLLRRGYCLPAKNLSNACCL